MKCSVFELHTWTKNAACWLRKEGDCWKSCETYDGKLAQQKISSKIP